MDKLERAMEIKKNLAELEEERKLVLDKIEKLWQELANITSPFKVGDTLLLGGISSEFPIGTRVKVVEITRGFFGEDYTIWISKFKKNGELYKTCSKLRFPDRWSKVS